MKLYYNGASRHSRIQQKRVAVYFRCSFIGVFVAFVVFVVWHSFLRADKKKGTAGRRSLFHVQS